MRARTPSRRCAGGDGASVRTRRAVIHGSRELEGAYQHGSRAAHGMRRLRAKAARLEAISARCRQRALRQRIHGAALVAEGAEYPVAALYDDGEIGADGASGFAFGNAGQTEYKQQILRSARGTLKAQAHAGGARFSLAFASRAAIRPVDVCLDCPGNVGPQ